MTIVDFERNHDAGLELVVAGLTHDVRGTLCVIKTLGALAAGKVANGDLSGAMQTLARLDAAVTQGSDLCGDALECGRRRAAGADEALPLEDFDLVEVVRHCVALHAGVIEQARCVTDLRLPASAPVRSHRRSSERILTNLLRNAARYGAGAPIDVHVHPGARGTVVIVRDHGRGIPRESLEKLFAPYRGADDEDRCFERFGLGLWIVRNLAHSLGGWLAVASEAGVGTAISFCLPADSSGPSTKS